MTRLQAQALGVVLGRRPVLDGAELTLEGGALTVIVGRNGAGKTTLMRCLAGLLAPRHGRVLLDGRPLASRPARERARLVAYLPQGGTVAWPLTVATVAALGRLPHGERPGALPPAGRAAVREALAATGLEALAERPATALSGGERARALLARALATQAPVLLADEPVAALDPRHQLVVLDALRGYAHAGAVVGVIMHDLGLAARFADRIVLVDAGRVGAEGTPGDVLTQERIARSFGIAARVACHDGRLTIVPERPLP